MKIGFFGNANNSPFTLARALRRMGHEVLFFIDRAPVMKWEILNRPENAYPEITLPYPDWIVDVSPLDLWAYPAPSPVRGQVVQMLNQCDLVFLNEFGLSLGPDLRCPTVAVLTGTDLEVLSSYSYAALQTPDGPPEWRATLHRHFLNLVEAHRQGIRSSLVILYPAKGFIPKGDQMLQEIGVTDEQRIYFHLSDLEKIDYSPPPHNSPLRVLCMARLTWKKPDDGSIVTEMDYKGSDIMIKGMGMFWRETGIPLDIRLIRKGKDIEETRALIAAEGLTSQVTWLDEMSNLEVLEENRRADIVFEQLGQGVFGLGCVDAMATGRPVIANGRPEIVARELGQPMPICQALTPVEVCEHLKALSADPALRARIGVESRRFVERHFSPEGGANSILKRVFTTLAANWDGTVAMKWRALQEEHARQQKLLARMAQFMAIKGDSAAPASGPDCRPRSRG